MTLASTRTRRFPALQALVVATVLSACGGSGGAGDPPVPPPAAGTAPTITAQPQDASVAEGLSASFSVTASGSGTLSYQWQRGEVDLAGATSTTFSLGAAGTADDHAAYRVRVSNAAGSVFSRTATLSVQAAVGNTLALLAGAVPPDVPTIASADSMDGTGAGARFYSVTSMTSDGTGNIYLTEPYAVRKITPAGTVTTVAGRLIATISDSRGNWGFANGYGSSALFAGLRGIVMGDGGSLYVADSSNRMIREITPHGEARTLAGLPGVKGTADGTTSQARFNFPLALARDRAGNVYVVDASPGICVDDTRLGSVPIYNGFTVRKISTAGVVSTLPGAGVAPNTSTTALLQPAIAVDADGNVYVSVTEIPRPFALFGVGCGSFRRPATTAYIQKITPAGQVSVFAGSKSQAGAADGAAADARFQWPSQLAFDARGALFVGDVDNQAVRRIGPDGQVTTPIGQLSAAPAASVALGALPGRLTYIRSLAVLPTDAIALATGVGESQLVLRTERR